MGSPLEEKPSAPSRHGFCVTLPRRHAVDDEVGRAMMTGLWAATESAQFSCNGGE